MTYTVQRLASEDLGYLNEMLSVFGEAFDDRATYDTARPSATYFKRLLGQRGFIALVALKRGVVVGGLVAYELQKFEQARSEIYIYDLAVAEPHRRQGIATALIDELKAIAKTLGAYVIFVQADQGDMPAIALYTKLGVREDVLHFDITVDVNAARAAAS